MSIQTIKDEQDLGTKGNYVRHLIDPAILIATRSGDCFKRRDGKDWPFPALKIEADASGKLERMYASAYGDVK